MKTSSPDRNDFCPNWVWSRGVPPSRERGQCSCAPTELSRHETNTRTQKGHRIPVISGHLGNVMKQHFRRSELKLARLLDVYAIAPRSVRIPPPPRAVRLHACRSERCWRCTETRRTQQDTKDGTRSVSLLALYLLADIGFTASGQVRFGKAMPTSDIWSWANARPPRGLPHGSERQGPTAPPRVGRGCRRRVGAITSTS
jgi:hypothetical protein